MEPPRRPPRPSDPRAEPITTPPAARPPLTPPRAPEHRYDTDPQGMPAMRPRTPSGHDPMEDLFRRLGSVEARTGEIPGMRVRQDFFEREVAEIRGKLDYTGHHVLEGQVGAATYKAVIEEERRKRAEAEQSLDRKLAEEQRNKRIDGLQKVLIALIGIVLGYFAHGFHP